jgi:hypothetical protein
VGWLAGEAKIVRECLNPGGLAHRERAVLFGMDVPVAILGQMGGYAAAEVLPLQSLVLVGEDVPA